MTQIDSEKIIERRLVELVKQNKGLCIKLLCNHIIGLPDRLCLFPGSRMIFVELKTTGQKPKKIQVYVHNKIKALGFEVIVIDSINGVNQLIERFK